jgi:sec-independent protein translocase protein TatC
MTIDTGMSWVEHLEELRYRIIAVIVIWLLCSIVIFVYTPHIINYFTGIIHKPLAFFTPTEAFWAQIKLAGWGGFFCSTPLIIYHLYRFILPALYPRERKWLNLLTPLSLLLFLAGCAFALLILLPFSLNFLIGFAEHQNLQAVLSVQEVINFSLFLFLACALAFELPLVLMFLALLGVISSELLSKQWRAAILIIFIASGILTPTIDIFTQILVAVPLVLLYLISLFLIRLIKK